MTTYATKKIDVSLHSLSFIATAIAQMNPAAVQICI